MVFIKKIKSGSKIYSYLVHSYRDKGAVRQKTIKRLTPEEANDPNFISDFLATNPQYLKTNRKAIILAAGKSTRLYPHSQQLPKTMVPIGDKNKPILRYIIETLQVNGISDIVVITGYQDDTIAKQFTGEVQLIYNPFFTVSGILASLWLANHEIGDDKELLILYSDLLFHHQVISNLLSNEADLVVAITHSPTRTITEKVIVEGDNLKHISSSIPVRMKNADFAGIIKCSPKGAVLFKEALENMAREDSFLQSYPSNLLERLLLKGEQIKVVEISSEFWVDINTSQDLQRAENEVIKNITT